MDDDVHALLVTTKEETASLRVNYARAVSRYFMPLKPGHDYFSGIDVPYLDHEDHNPRFCEQRDAIAPIVTRIKEQIAQKDVQLLEEHQQQQA